MRKYLSSLSWIVLIATLVCYGAVLIPPEKFWPAGILVYGILPFQVLNLFLIIIFIFFARRIIYIPLIGLLAGIIFIKITFSYHVKTKVEDGKKSFEVLSFNVKNFGSGKKGDLHSLEMINWLLNDSSDIKCVQEFHSHNDIPEYDVVGRIISKGYNYHFLFKDSVNVSDFEGLAIFTRYPILNRGILLLQENSGNNCIYVDLKIGIDTIRIYNVHLYSMRIPLYAYKDPSNYESKLKSLVRKLKNGAINRSREIDRLIRHAEGCPYPFIICGDFNDIPYSQNYLTLRDHFTNAFEKAGHGFGFSFNHKLFFLRIDHQFVNDGIRPLSFRVDHSMKDSDHFPTRGIYHLQ
jgi:endonuclease/exonuclease/phosphatase family metal-dependent hydrolase